MEKQPEPYVIIAETIDKNPISGFYSELEDIVNIKVPRIGGHLKVLKNVCQRIGAVREDLDAVVSMEVNGNDVINYRWKHLESKKGAIGLALLLYEEIVDKVESFQADINQRNPGYAETINPDSPQDYLFYLKPLLYATGDYKGQLEKELANTENRITLVDEYLVEAGNLRDFIHYLHMAIDQAIYECRSEQSHQVFVKDDQDFQKAVEFREIVDISKRAVANIEKFAADREVLFPETLDYKEVLPSVIRIMKKEYYEFITNPQEYCQSQREAINSKLRKGLKLPPRLTVVPLAAIIH